MNIPEIFSTVVDFRQKGMILHSLSDILTISLFAVLCGADDFEEIAEFGLAKEPFFRKFLTLANGIPSHDTFNRIFRNLNPVHLERCLISFSKELISDLCNYQITIDGKVLRATAQSGKKCSGLCLVSAWVAGANVSLGQVKVNEKSNEKTAIPVLLDSLSLEGNLVSIDAMACHQSIANQITEAKGDYLLALKKNQKVIYEQVHDFMQRRKADLQSFTYTDYVGGRIEKRTTYLSNSVEFIDNLQGWNTKSILMVERERSNKNSDKPIKKSTHFYISSDLKDAKYFNQSIRSHWAIENNLHWQLDVVFREDRQRVRKDNGPENIAVMRKISLQALKKNKGKSSIKNTRKKAGWKDDFLIQIIENLFSED